MIESLLCVALGAFLFWYFRSLGTNAPNFRAILARILNLGSEVCTGCDHDFKMHSPYCGVMLDTSKAMCNCVRFR